LPRLTPLSSLLIIGHAKIIDEFFSNPRATYYDTVIRDKIAFHDPHASDPDWMVRQCYLLMIELATEVIAPVDQKFFFT
jgi:hypothetical protein